MQELVTEYHVRKFSQRGFVVIQNVLTEAEVVATRRKFHDELKLIGIDHESILNGQTFPPKECGIKSPVSHIYYSRWKLLDTHLHPNVVHAMHMLLQATFLDPDQRLLFPSPSPIVSSTIWPYIDRVCYRLPNHIRNEQGLGLHLDRHPTMPFAHIKKWRPIQAFVTLTDHCGKATGGLQVVPEFHEKGHEIKESEGEFYRMGDHAYDRLRKSLVTVQAPKGSLVCWDNRLPHATCSHLNSPDSREVVFVGFLPDVKLNRDYVARQRINLLASLSPPAYDSVPVRAPDFAPTELSAEQRQLLGL